jgi:hypothetical protein
MIIPTRSTICTIPIGIPWILVIFSGVVRASVRIFQL